MRVFWRKFRVETRHHGQCYVCYTSSYMNTNLTHLVRSSSIFTPAMAWPYHILDLSEGEKHLRRELLDRYGVYAQLSAMVPILGFQLYRIWIWVFSERKRSKVAYSQVSSSPVAKHARRSSSGSLTKHLRGMVWWFEGEIAKGWGLRGHWIAAGLWTSWLLFLCINRTGHGMSSPFFVTFIVSRCTVW